MSEQRIFEALELCKKEYHKAAQRYTYRSEDLANTADQKSFSIQEVGSASDIVREGIEISKEYFFASEAIIISLDATARPLLDSSPSAQAVGAVADFITDVTSDMDKSTRTFSVSYNNVNLGEAVKVAPSAGVIAKSTQLFWEQQYRSMPDYADEEQRRKNEVAEKSKRKQEKSDSSKKSVEFIESKIKKLKEAHYPVEKERIKLRNRCNEALISFERSAENYLASFIKKLPDINKAKSLKTKERIKKLKSELKVTSKEKRNEIIEEIKYLEAESEAILSPEYLEQQIIRCNNSIKKYVDKYSEKLDNYFNKCYITKHSTETFNIDSEVENPDDKILHGIEANIFTWIFVNKWITVDGLKKGFPEFSTVKISSALLKLKQKNLIEQISVDSTTYYGLPSEPFEYKYTVFKENSKMIKSSFPEAEPIELKETDYNDFSALYNLTEALTVAKAKKIKHKIIISSAIALAVLIIFGVTVWTIISKTNRANQFEVAYDIATEEADKLLDMNTPSVKALCDEYGVTDINVTVEDVIFVNKKYQLYNDEHYYLVKLRVDCTATDQKDTYNYLLPYNIKDLLPRRLGVVDRLNIQLYSEAVSNSDELYGGEPYMLNNKMMVYIYINGDLALDPLDGIA